MTDERIDRLVDEGARSYNEPGPVPREVLWQRIQEARAARRANPAHSTSRRYWIWPGAAAAAAILLAAGIAVGRFMERRSAQVGNPGAQVAASESSSVVRPAPRDTITEPQAAPSQRLAVAPDSETRAVLSRLRTETTRTAQRARQLASARPSQDSVQASGEALQYRLVLLEHLAGSEAMITAFRASARQGSVDPQMASWSQDLVTTTRMLEASRAAADPVMKRLLEDLDLVLTEIAHYATTGQYSPDELDVIDHAITHRGVLSRLRTTTSPTTSRVPLGT